jgi:putative endonuclease
MMAAGPAGNWFVYIIVATDDRYYTGITTDLERRWRQHRDQVGGARFFRGRKPRELVYVETGHNRSSASKREAEIKQLSRQEKTLLIASKRNEFPLNP